MYSLENYTLDSLGIGTQATKILRVKISLIESIEIKLSLIMNKKR